MDPQPGECIDVDNVKVGEPVFVRYGLTWEKVDVVLTPGLGLVAVKLPGGQIRRLCEFVNKVKSACLKRVFSIYIIMSLSANASKPHTISTTSTFG